ncbi:MAG: 5,10-methylenetetrahydrofolate reductase, partial [Actinobacteria bacterium]|nr:5,10-methylenetetrahydrofolate reductase [Candidatus Fonsibacter lacus]
MTAVNSSTGLSFELFPPKDSVGEDRLWETLAQLSDISPDFLSVTYG